MSKFTHKLVYSMVLRPFAGSFTLVLPDNEVLCLSLHQALDTLAELDYNCNSGAYDWQIFGVPHIVTMRPDNE